MTTPIPSFERLINAIKELESLELSNHLPTLPKAQQEIQALITSLNTGETPSPEITASLLDTFAQVMAELETLKDTLADEVGQIANAQQALGNYAKYTQAKR